MMEAYPTPIRVTDFQRAVLEDNQFEIARCVRTMRKAGANNDQIFQVARTALPDMTTLEWAHTAFNALQRHPEMYERDARVELAPHLDDWMKGDRFGDVIGNTPGGLVRVKLDRSGLVKTFAAIELRAVVFLQG